MQADHALAEALVAPPTVRPALVGRDRQLATVDRGRLATELALSRVRSAPIDGPPGHGR